MKNTTRRIAILGLCASVAMILSYVESLLPPLLSSIPGIKMGLPNIVVVFVLYRLGARDAITVSLVRVLAVALLFGTPVSMAYSAAGAVLSFLGMVLLKKTDRFSPTGVSIAGAVAHNLGQVICSAVLMRTTAIVWYFFVLVISGVIGGCIVGLLAAWIMRRFEKHVKL